jgi:hypothetical protein
MNPTKYDNDYELYELVLKDNEDEVFALSLVNEPAIQQDFVWFNKEGKVEVKFATADESQHTIVGPILIPNLNILRVKEDGTPYYVTFTKDTVKQIAQKYIKDNNANNITLEHEAPVNGVSLVESWVVDSAKYDKSKMYGLNAKPGTWMGVFKVDNPTIWNNYVKTGKVKGISLEGLFSHVLIKASLIELADVVLEKEITELSNEEAQSVLNKIKHIIKQDNRYKKGQRIDRQNMDGEGGQPSITSSYAGQFGPGKKKKSAGEYIHPALINKK